MPFRLVQNGGEYDAYPTLEAAVGTMQVFSPAYPDDVFAVEDEGGAIVASMTGQRITGVFHKQAWDANNYALDCGSVDFDATDHVLQMPFSAVVALEDNRETTDVIGQAHVQWSGPHYVDICDAIATFFGVDHISEITQQNFEFVRGERNPLPREDKSVEVTLKLTLHGPHGFDVNEAVSSIYLSAVSNVPGVVVRSVATGGVCCGS